MDRPKAVVIGQAARDLVVRIGELPPARGTSPVHRRWEGLGGKGANQAVALAQLGAAVALIAVVGDDEAGRAALDQARRDGIDVGNIAIRAHTTTALYVDLVSIDDDDRVAGGEWRYLEDVPEGTLLRAADITAARDAIGAADLLILQLQQPADAVITAIGLRPEHGLLITDGTHPDTQVRESVLAAADVVRADTREAQLFAGRPLGELDDVIGAARELVACGPRLVALAAGSRGNVVAWDGGHVVVPLGSGPVIDTTGGGDSFVAGLALGLASGAPYERVARIASAASGLTVAHPGGRPQLTPDAVGLPPSTERSANAN